ncbi:XRE family transcriptional regulator [Weissella confusa]|uniref:helix-turn-helix domain-containing protein n=1 Tax=Weissella confusa TaxID=1583 RepID=UPI00223A9A11|nr:helix-turn-helix transcriptional regulator [Weissella confusa]MCS9997158.1 XRE family transcriptional regulator [Weissella confusa]
MELKDRLSQLRKTKGVSLATLGAAVGINRITISRYEKGERKPKYERLEKLAAYFGVSVPYLMGIDDNEEQ